MKLTGILAAVMVLASAMACAQPLPNAPQTPPTLTDTEWQSIEHLPRGKPIFVRVANAPPLDCLFAGATDQFLFCDPIKDSWRRIGFQIERANVLQVSAIRVDHDWHPVVLGVAAVVGIAAGVNAVRGYSANQAAGIGLMAGSVTAAIGLGVEGGLPPPGGNWPVMGVQVNVPLQTMGRMARVPRVPRLLRPRR